MLWTYELVQTCKPCPVPCSKFCVANTIGGVDNTLKLMGLCCQHTKPSLTGLVAGKLKLVAELPTENTVLTLELGKLC